MDTASLPGVQVVGKRASRADLSQYRRKVSLQVFRAAKKSNNPSAFDPAVRVLDLSDMHIQFKTASVDEETPNNCSIRVYNLKDETVNELTRPDIARVVLQAGYAESFGVIFDGDIKQFHIGRLSGTDTYVDILAADGDLGYNFAVSNQTLAAGVDAGQRRDRCIADLAAYGITPGKDLAQTGGTLPRGKVLFGLSRILMRNECDAVGATWSIQNGRVNVTPLDGYLPGDAVVLTAATGLIGIPEQTENGIEARCLLNPRIIAGQRVRIDNKSINRTLTAGGALEGLPFNRSSVTQPQRLATVRDDGEYRVLVADHEGDTRGQPWYTNITCLAIDPSIGKVKAGA